MRIPAAVAAGDYHVAYVVDPDGALAELDETNDVFVSKAKVRVVPVSLAILTETIPVATVGVDFEFAFAAAGGSGSYRWASVGTLPSGLVFAADSGVLSGRPTTEGLFELSVSVADGAISVARAYRLVVTDAPRDLAIATRSLFAAYVGRRYELPLVAVGGVRPYVWSATGTIPTGLALDPSGVLAGTPAAADSKTVTFRVTHAFGTRLDQFLAVRVISPGNFGVSPIVDFLPTVVGDAYEYRFVEESGTGVSPYTVTIVEGTLPPGLSLDGDLFTGTSTRGF